MSFKELDFAINNNKIILPLLTEDIEIPKIFSDIKYSKFSNNFNQGLQDVLKLLKNEFDKAI